MNVLKHFVGQPFVFATGLAALVHSTWSLGTLFAGNQPQDALALVGWLVPALLIAFALDIGQIATSSEIRAYGLTWRRGVTFVVFAAATYYLQWLYAAHHMPALELAAGVRASWEDTATVLRDAAVWIIPALLPLSTLLYTFSGEGQHRTTAPAAPLVVVEQPAAAPAPELAPALPALEPEETPQLAAALTPDEFTAVCDACGWSGDGYKTEQNATRALKTHQDRHCKVLHAPTSSNGHGLIGVVN